MFNYGFTITKGLDKAIPLLRDINYQIHKVKIGHFLTFNNELDAKKAWQCLKNSK